MDESAWRRISLPVSMPVTPGGAYPAARPQLRRVFGAPFFRSLDEIVRGVAFGVGEVVFDRKRAGTIDADEQDVVYLGLL
jgi:hypothetical protein